MTPLVFSAYNMLTPNFMFSHASYHVQQQLNANELRFNTFTDRHNFTKHEKKKKHSAMICNKSKKHFFEYAMASQIFIFHNIMQQNENNIIQYNDGIVLQKSNTMVYLIHRERYCTSRRTKMKNCKRIIWNEIRLCPSRHRQNQR